MNCPNNPFEFVQKSYIGLPAQRCQNCGSLEFGRIGRDLHCLACHPTSAADEFLRGAYSGGLLRWVEGLPPHDSSLASRWLYVATDLDTFDVEPHQDARESLWGPIWKLDYVGQWYHRLSVPYLAWIGGQIERLKVGAFPEDYADAKSQLDAIVARGIAFGQLPTTCVDAGTWPESTQTLSELFAEAAEIDEVFAWSLKYLPPTPLPIQGELKCNPVSA